MLLPGFFLSDKFLGFCNRAVGLLSKTSLIIGDSDRPRFTSGGNLPLASITGNRRAGGAPTCRGGRCPWSGAFTLWGPRRLYPRAFRGRFLVQHPKSRSNHLWTRKLNNFESYSTGNIETWRRRKSERNDGDGHISKAPVFGAGSRRISKDRGAGNGGVLIQVCYPNQRARTEGSNKAKRKGRG